MTDSPPFVSRNPLELITRKIGELRSSTKYFDDYKMLIVVGILHGFAFQILFLSPEFIQENSSSHNVGNFLVGVNFALFQTVSIVLVLALSRVSDSRARRKGLLLIIVLFGALVGFAEAFVSYIGNIPLYIFLFMLYMASIYGSDILMVVLVTEYFQERMKGVALGFMASVAIIGWACGALLSGYLYENMGMEICFLLSAMAMLLSFFALTRIRDLGQTAEVKGISDVLREGIRILRDRILSLKEWSRKMSGVSLETIDRYLFDFGRRKQMAVTFYTMLMVSIGSGMINPFIINFLDDRGVSETTIGLVFAIFGVIIFLPVNRFAAGWLSDRYSARMVFSASVMAYIPLWAIFNLSIRSTEDNTVILAIYAFPIWPFLYIGYQLFVTDMTARTERARGLSSIRFAMGLGYVVGAIFGALLLLFDVSHETLFWLAMIFIFIAAFMALNIMRNPIFSEGEMPADTR